MFLSEKIQVEAGMTNPMFAEWQSQIDLARPMRFNASIAARLSAESRS